MRVSRLSLMTSTRCSSDGEGVALDELVNVGQGGRHPLGQGRVAGDAFNGLTHTTRWATRRQSGHLLGQHLGIAAVPPVGEDHDDRAPGHAPDAPASLNSRSPSPSRVPPDQSAHGGRAAAEGGVGVVGRRARG